MLENCVLGPHVLLLRFVPLDFEEHNVLRAPSDQCLVVDKHHLPQVPVGHITCIIFGDIAGIYVDVLALSVEGVDHVRLIIVETFVREVFSLLASQINHHRPLHHLVGARVYDQVVMFKGLVIKQIQKHVRFRNEAACHIWVHEPIYSHCPVIYST